MKCILLVLALFGLTLAEDLEIDVIGVTVLPATRSLYEVAILSKDDKGVVNICSGALIHPLWILTSGSCASRARNLRIQFSNTIEEPDKLGGAFINDRIVHPSYSPVTLVNDIALIKLVESAPLTVDLLELPEATENFVGQTGLGSGFGNSARGAHDIGTLHETYSGIQNNAFCNMYGPPLTTNQFCTAPSSTCEGDQGGPLVVGRKLVGICSMSDSLATLCGEGYLSYYTSPAKYRPWIKTVTGINMF